MPNLNRYRIANDPTSQDTNGESVISRDHPDNARECRDNTRTYTYRQRSMKLNFTLGWELEANHAPIRRPVGVDVTCDGSVNGDGAEFVVLPAVTKSPRYVLGLLKDLVHTPKLNTDESCGFHVHVSASNLGNLQRMRQWAIATEYLALQVEDLAFKAVPESRAANQYCRKIVPITNGTTFDIHKYNNSRRYHWLNIVEMFRPNGIRTIENRLLGHTHRWKYVLAWSLFTMELGRRGWELSNRPFDMKGHIDCLTGILKKIATDIKPLSKRAEPVPAWVYQGLGTFGIKSNAWDRPLARIAETEADLHGIFVPAYSDDQPEIANRSEDEDSCACGCGDEGTCERQLHEDGDCDSNECYHCHEDGQCDGSESCDWYQDNAHENGDECGRSMCRRCNPERLTPANPRPAVRARPIVDPHPVTASELFNVTMTSSGTVPPNPPSSADIQAAVNSFRNAQIDHVNMMVNRAGVDAMMYGRGIVEMLYDGPVPTGVFIDEISNEPVPPSLDEEMRAASMLDMHESAMSIDREFNQGGR